MRCHFWWNTRPNSDGSRSILPNTPQRFAHCSPKFPPALHPLTSCAFRVPVQNKPASIKIPSENALLEYRSKNSSFINPPFHSLDAIFICIDSKNEFNCLTSFNYKIISRITKAGCSHLIRWDNLEERPFCPWALEWHCDHLAWTRENVLNAVLRNNFFINPSFS